MFKRGDIFKVSEYFRSTTLQHDGFVGRGELFSAEGFLLGSDIFFVFVMRIPLQDLSRIPN